MPDSLFVALRKMLDATDTIVNSEGRNVDLDALYEARSDAREALDYLDNPKPSDCDHNWHNGWQGNDDICPICGPEES